MAKNFNKLLNNLKTDLEWAEANEWESPICLSDDLKEVIELMEALQTLEKVIKTMEPTNDGMPTLKDNPIAEIFCAEGIKLDTSISTTTAKPDGTWTAHNGKDTLYVNVN